MVKQVEELLVFQKALEAADEVSALLNSEGFAKDLRLRSQIGAASERVASLIAEGFEQKTDRHFASYLHLARGSSSETRTQLRVARGRGHISEADRIAVAGRYQEIEKMLRGLIRHLTDNDWKERR
jgi:four helix bundle protein